MNYGELRSQFLSLLNRDDCSDSLADTFITLGLRRIERRLRTPLQRATYEYTVPSEWDGKFTIPSNYLGLYKVTAKGYPLSRISQAQQDQYTGFWIQGPSFYFNVPLQQGEIISLEYYYEFPLSGSDTDVTGYSLVLSDVVMYAALVFAADHFIDSRKADYDTTFNILLEEVQQMADADDFAGGRFITPYGAGLV